MEVLEEHDEVQFLVSLDYSSNEADLYSCNEWADLYTTLGEYNNNPFIIDGDPNHRLWNMFAGSTYSAYAFIDHHMVLRYKFDMPNLYDFQYTYLPQLIDSMYGCTDPLACNYDLSAIYNDDTCLYNDECEYCSEALTQLECMGFDGCMWMGDHCMESNDSCSEFDNQLDCMNNTDCYWMGNHCMSGSSCTDPVALNYNPIADILETGDNSTCEYSSFLNFGCTYENALNFDMDANIDDNTCEYLFADLNNDGIINILDIMQLVNIIVE